jgi:release factor glutamine methyltransferase
MLSVLEILRRTTEFFAGKGVESPRLNAELLVGHALGLPRMRLYLEFERLLTEAELERLRPLVRRRGAREPLQYIRGETEFHGLRLKVDRRALIPRPETERLVELIIERAQPPPSSALDLGAGTGAIALALAAAWPQALVTAVDASAEALGLAAENAAALKLDSKVTWLRSDWFAALPPGARFGWIVSNPPYLPESEVAAAEPEVREHEPRAALVADDRGLAAASAIIAQASVYLEPGGVLALETGPEQHEELGRRAAAAGWGGVDSVKDLAGRPRYLFLSRRPSRVGSGVLAASFPA